MKNKKKETLEEKLKRLGLDTLPELSIDLFGQKRSDWEYISLGYNALPKSHCQKSIERDRLMFNEDSRLKISAILHLARLGYKYLSLKEQKWDESR